jgi:predicted protein tyrosine phosphatase
MEVKSKNILFICTSNKDRSPALQQYFEHIAPIHNYKSAGINKYFTSQKGTHLIDENDIHWADVLVFAEDVHLKVVSERFKASYNNDKIIFDVKYQDKNIPQIGKSCKYIVLNCGDYTQGAIGEDYLTKAEIVLRDIIATNYNLNEYYKK